jgi:hypothetical protein
LPALPPQRRRASSNEVRKRPETDRTLEQGDATHKRAEVYLGFVRAKRLGAVGAEYAQARRRE